MQSKIESALERAADLATGFIISYFAGKYLIFPALDIEVSHATNFAAVMSFTIISFVRGYIWRRIFNRLTIRKLKKEKSS